jgi:hypothetical protein
MVISANIPMIPSRILAGMGTPSDRIVEQLHGELDIAEIYQNR